MREDVPPKPSTRFRRLETHLKKRNRLPRLPLAFPNLLQLLLKLVKGDPVRVCARRWGWPARSRRDRF